MGEGGVCTINARRATQPVRHQRVAHRVLVQPFGRDGFDERRQAPAHRRHLGHERPELVLHGGDERGELTLGVGVDADGVAEEGEDEEEAEADHGDQGLDDQKVRSTRGACDIVRLPDILGRGIS